jgi:TPR repeat protein
MRKFFLILLLLVSMFMLDFNRCYAEWFVLPPDKLKEAIKTAESNDKATRTEAQGLLWLHYVALEDVDQAIKWGRKAAEAGTIQAMKFLFEAYWEGQVEGKTFKQDKNEALKWLKMASDAGDELSQKAYMKIQSE